MRLGAGFSTKTLGGFSALLQDPSQLKDLSGL